MILGLVLLAGGMAWGWNFMLLCLTLYAYLIYLSQR